MGTSGVMTLLSRTEGASASSRIRMELLTIHRAIPSVILPEEHSLAVCPISQ